MGFVMTGWVETLLAEQASTPLEGIEFGVNVSGHARDGECDDPRFEGPGMATNPSAAAAFQDAADCRSAYAKRNIWLHTAFGDIDFGDDSGGHARDGECDDPRFEGPGMATALGPEDVGRDRSDCEAAVRARVIRLTLGSKVFGDDSGGHARDGECDDPRFEKPGMATALGPEDVGRDRSDCMTAYNKGEIEWISMDTSNPEIDFGGNGSEFAYDGECDDPRFDVAGTSDLAIVGNDAVDCFKAYSEGARPRPTSDPDVRYRFGDNDSAFAYDGECDDPRFTGPGMVRNPNRGDIGDDATDCAEASMDGRIEVNEAYNWSPLLDAVIFEDIKAVESQLKELTGAALDKGSEGGNTPLIWAAWTNTNSAIIELLIKSGADPNTRNDQGVTPLNAAAWSDQSTEILNALTTDESLKIVATDERWTPLHGLASVTGNPEKLRHLVERGAKVNAQTESGWTPLHQVAWYNDNPGIVSALTALGAEKNPRSQDGRTPVYQAVANNNIQALEELLEHKADPDMPLENGETPLERSVKERNRYSCEILRDAVRAQGGAPEESCEF